MSEDWEQEFEELYVQINEDGCTFRPVEINKAIWRLNRTSMYLSRLLQFNLTGDIIKFDDEFYENVSNLGEWAMGIADALRLVEATLPDETCLECAEEDCKFED